MHFFLKITTKLFRMRKLSLGVLVAGFVLLSATAAYVLEPDTFGSWYNALYWVLTTMATVGYGDYFATTVAGKTLTIFIYIFGIGLLSLVIGKIIESLGSLQRRRGAGTLNFRGGQHILLINWSRKAQAAVEEIQSYSHDLHIVIIDESNRHPLEQMDRIHFVSGDPAKDEVLNQASIQTARAAIIFADSRIDEAALVDGKSLLIASSIERLAPQVHTTVEITQESNIQNFRHIHVNEFVLSYDAISRLAVRAALQEGNPEVIRQLLSRQHGDDLYEVPLQVQWDTYGDAFHALLSQGATLISDGGDLSINRKLDQAIPKNAKLFVVADEETYRRIVNK